MSTSVGPVDQALIPAEIRSGTAQQREAYTAALGFERQLVEQLTKQLSASTEAAGEEEESTSAATQTYKDMLPGALADAVIGAGGLGLAAQISRDVAAA